MILGGKKFQDAFFNQIIERMLTELPRSGPQRSGLMPSIEIDSALPIIDIDERETPFVPRTPKEEFVVQDANINKISQIGLDLRVSEEIYRGTATRTIKDVEQLRRLAQQGELTPVRPRNGLVTLDAHTAGENVYYIVSREKIQLPGNLDIMIDGRSNTARVACMCVPSIDNPLSHLLEPSPIVITAQPFAFPLEIKAGETSLAQAVLRWKDSAYMTVKEIREDSDNIAFADAYSGKSLNEAVRFTRHGATLTYQLRKLYVAKPIRDIPGPIRFDSEGTYEPSDYFEERRDVARLTIEPNRFYLMGTQEQIGLGNVCGVLSREVPETGQGVWVQFASIFQPGFVGPITMEVRPQFRRTIEAGDPAGYVLFDKMDGSLKKEKEYRGAFKHQDAPKLPKMFKTH